ncbi:transposase, partial [Streptomyces sp. ISL-36]|uniref:transposase family protein n=1 Tax=Streptomyces sp. ISL-36 TaxID=2819182 RepID=UPI001BE70EE6|nr:transposase [Streptomyces sp. ISL-36]
ACGPAPRCPGCRAPARRVHSSHERGLAERPLTGKELQVRLRVRRFFCDRTSCHKKTFVEPVSRLSERCRRSSLGWGAVGTTFFQSAAPGLAKPAQAISPLIVWSSPARRTGIGVSLYEWPQAGLRVDHQVGGRSRL